MGIKGGRREEEGEREGGGRGGRKRKEGMEKEGRMDGEERESQHQCMCLQEEVCARYACKCVLQFTHSLSEMGTSVCADYHSKGCRARDLRRLPHQYTPTLAKFISKQVYKDGWLNKFDISILTNNGEKGRSIRPNIYAHRALIIQLAVVPSLILSSS